jgi:hypothetical protein
MSVLVQKHRPDWIHGEKVIFDQTITRSMSLLSLDASSSQSGQSVDQPVSSERKIVEYESDDDMIMAEYKEAHKLAAKVMVKPAEHGNRHNNGLPYHCPVLTCKQRFKDCSKTYDHWRRKLHDGDRGDRAVTDIAGLLTSADYCARTDDPDDKTYCLNCQMYEMMHPSAKKAGRGRAASSGPSKRKRSRPNADDVA